MACDQVVDGSKYAACSFFTLLGVVVASGAEKLYDHGSAKLAPNLKLTIRA
jgi:hypothetical protein